MAKYIEDKSKRVTITALERGTIHIFQSADGRIYAKDSKGNILGMERCLQSLAKEILIISDPVAKQHKIDEFRSSTDLAWLCQCDDNGTPAQIMHDDGTITTAEFRWCLVSHKEIPPVAFITNANFKKIFRNYYGQDDDKTTVFLWEAELRGIIDNVDIQRIRSFVSFCKDPQGYVSLRVYHGDTYKWLNEVPPKYHKNDGCEWLHKDYFGIKLPHKISEKGSAQKTQGIDDDNNVANAFRRKYREYKLDKMVRLFHNETKAQGDTGELRKTIQEAVTQFVQEWNEHYDPKLSKDEIWTDVVESSNSGSTNIADGDINTIKQDIDQQIKELKVLLEHVSEVKRHIINQIENYYIIESNPERKWDTTWLESLGFEACGSCYPGKIGRGLFNL